MTPEWEDAIASADVDGLRSLLDQGADIDAKDRHGQTGLMRAASRGRAGVVGLLVDRGAALDHAAKYNLSALMLAVINGHVEIARMLVQAGADTGIRGSGAPGFQHKNAMDLAAAQGRDDMLEVLRAAP